jgi:hypothetical protein
VWVSRWRAILHRPACVWYTFVFVNDGLLGRVLFCVCTDDCLCVGDHRPGRLRHAAHAGTLLINPKGYWEHLSQSMRALEHGL